MGAWVGGLAGTLAGTAVGVERHTRTPSYAGSWHDTQEVPWEVA